MSMSNFYLGAQTIQGGVLLFQFPSTCAYYSRAQIVQGNTVFCNLQNNFKTTFGLTKNFSSCVQSKLWRNFLFHKAGRKLESSDAFGYFVQELPLFAFVVLSKYILEYYETWE